MTPTHIGWLRPAPRSRWQDVCWDTSYDECWRQLLRVAVPPDSHVERVVLPVGVHPSEKERKR